MAEVLTGGDDGPAGLGRRLMVEDPATGMAPLLSGGRPPIFDNNNTLIDPGTISGIDKLLLTLAS